MGLFIRRLFWFILVLASGFVAAIIAGKQYGFNIGLTYWAKFSGLHEVSGVTEVINKVPALLDLPLIKSYGFYGSLGLFLFFLLIFTISLRSRRDKESEAVDTESTKADLDTDSVPNSLGDTFDGTSTATEFVAETNSEAIVGTDGNVYDGTATFSGTDTYGHIDSRSQFDTSAGADEYNEDDDEAEADILDEASVSAVDDDETGLSHLTDAELKSKTLDFAEKIRSFEEDYQRSRDETTAELTDFSSEESLNGALQDVKDSYEERQEAFSSEFKNNYRPAAVAVRDEISKRLGISEPSDNFNPALDSGMLVGTNPVADAADLIEELVKKLA
jgi:hypothetical protein